ncbi:hypothetical protein D9Q81_01300 [Candidatus Korarchaeum cryptofilum]|uniref:Uncharacterized protein n=1 Tax=Candidatus Korarchaeum cryptofilum TaxID=498846 RepID=A0A429G997_9CREN|nr:hypothetical protein [Candidatus Korarchaeum cryptofilum]RSN70334.1 hypothetical protein D9Q81_01300 [Candidatus Korarchaeum cryptofilum]
MGLGMEIVGGYAEAPGDIFTPVTPFTGDSFLVKNANPAKRTFLGSAWAYLHVEGAMRIRSPKLHDNVQGLNWTISGYAPVPVLEHDTVQTVYPQDVLTVEVTGSSTAGQVEQACLLMYYEDLPGVNARLVNWTDIAGRIKNIFTVRVNLTTTSAKNWTGTAAINSYVDLFKANVDYALLGYMTSPMATAVGIRGPDTGNMRIGGPALGSSWNQTRDYFVRLNRKWGVPTIPVINGSNKFSTTVDVAANEMISGVKVTLIFAELG